MVPPSPSPPHTNNTTKIVTKILGFAYNSCDSTHSVLVDARNIQSLWYFKMFYKTSVLNGGGVNSNSWTISLFAWWWRKILMMMMMMMIYKFWDCCCYWRVVSRQFSSMMKVDFKCLVRVMWLIKEWQCRWRSTSACFRDIRSWLILLLSYCRTRVVSCSRVCRPGDGVRAPGESLCSQHSIQLPHPHTDQE